MINTTNFLELEREQQRSVIEAMIFASEDALSLNNLFNLLIINDFVKNGQNGEEQIGIHSEVQKKYSELKDYLKELIDEINIDLQTTERPYRIVEVAGGFQFGTVKEYGKFVHEVLRSKTKKRLSHAALEVLSIVAYKQPISKPEIEQIRGVNSNEIVNSLIDKEFIKISGRSESLGKPLLYSTTDEFLRAFGLKSLNDLPKLRELQEIAKTDVNLGDDEAELTISVMEKGELENLNEGKLVKIEDVENNNN